MKKRKLKKWVKIAIAIIILIVFTLLINITINNFNNIADECDNVKGYTCSIYEIKNFK